MLPEQLKTRILSNQFLPKLQTNFELDRAAYAELVEALQCLAKEWSEEQLVDKEISAFLYGISRLVAGTFMSSLQGPAISHPELEDIVVELDVLALDCFATPMSMEDLLKDVEPLRH